MSGCKICTRLSCLLTWSLLLIRRLSRTCKWIWTDHSTCSIPAYMFGMVQPIPPNHLQPPVSSTLPIFPFPPPCPFSRFLHLAHFPVSSTLPIFPFPPPCPFSRFLHLAHFPVSSTLPIFPFPPPCPFSRFLHLAHFPRFLHLADFPETAQGKGQGELYPPQFCMNYVHIDFLYKHIPIWDGESLTKHYICKISYAFRVI